MEDLRNRARPYACPHCGALPHPNCYDNTYRQKVICYRMKGGSLEFPLIKGKPIACCEGYFVAPYHSSEREYLEAIDPYLAFFAPTTNWIQNLLKTGELEKEIPF
jgi:hypothetical protein